MKIRLPNVSVSSASQMAFALVEVVVGAGLLGIMMISLYGGMSSGFAVTQLARENLRATQIMLERMEGLRLYKWDQVTNTTLNPQLFYERYYPGASGIGTANGIIYTGQVQFATVDLTGSTYESNMLKCTVTVQWVSGNVLR